MKARVYLDPSLAYEKEIIELFFFDENEQKTRGKERKRFSKAL